MSTLIRILVRTLTAAMVGVCLFSAHLTMAQDGDQAAQGGGDQATAEVRAPAFDDAVKDIAGQVGKFLQAEGTDSISVGPFTGPPATSGGPAIVQGIKKNLPQDIRTDSAKPAVALQGTYRLPKDKISGRNCIVIEGKLVDQDGEEKMDISKYVLTDEQSIIKLMGGSGDLPVKANPGESLADTRNKQLVQNIRNPQPEVSASIARPSSDSPFGVEILFVGPGNQLTPAPLTVNEGIPFVDIPKDQIYAIRLINDGGDLAAAEVLIDGINSLSMSAEYAQVGKWVIAPKSPKAIVRGWHKQGKQSTSFRVTDYGDSVAARSQFTGPEVGSITVAFCAAFTQQPPADEPKLDVATKGGLATGEGPPVEQPTKAMPVNFGAARGVVTIRYVRPNSDPTLPAQENLP